ncbi:OsmC family protein [Flagellimonas marina]|uniref:OsmC family protein n=1 Tax=Flagellimonas marina TaxID=1775168 RepID=A0ABV8PPN6_9FLAO
METIEITLEQQSSTGMKLNNSVLEIIVDRPKEQGGGGTGLMGGQYLLTGIGGCYCSTFFAAAESRGLEIKGLRVQIIAVKSTDLPKRFTEVKLLVSYEECSDKALFKKVLAIAEKGCLSINTIKNGTKFKVETLA